MKSPLFCTNFDPEPTLKAMSDVLHPSGDALILFRPFRHNVSSLYTFAYVYMTCSAQLANDICSEIMSVQLASCVAHS